MAEHFTGTSQYSFYHFLRFLILYSSNNGASFMDNKLLLILSALSFFDEVVFFLQKRKFTMPTVKYLHNNFLVTFKIQTKLITLI